MKKVIRLTESDLEQIVKRVIEEQKKFQLFINPGQTAEAELIGEVLTLFSQMGKNQIFRVKTSLPAGKFMFEYGKDGKYYGYDKNGKKHEILFIEKRK